MKARTSITRLALLSCLCLISRPARTQQEVQLLLRCDDIGMCHAVNQAAERAIASGLPLSMSVMFACPWYVEAVELLRRHPEVSVGVHLTLNAEWQHYRWGPVAGWNAVPSLTDSCGMFWPSRALLFQHGPRLEETELELRAQIERARATGLRIDYLDYHMGTAVQTAELRALVERLAREYGLGISRYFGEEDVAGAYATPPGEKLDTMRAALPRLAAGTIHLMVFHIGLDTEEMQALVDMNPGGLAFVSRHRQSELEALCSDGFRELCAQKGLRLITYRELIGKRGLESMRAPAHME